MAIRVRCKCGKLFLAKDSFVGKRAKCPGCKQKVTVPDPRKQYAKQVVLDQMVQNAASNPSLSSIVTKVGDDLDTIGSQISQLQSELAEVRKLLDTA